MAELDVKEEIIDERVIVRKKSKKRYLNGNDFHQSLIDYYAASEKNPNTQISRYIGECINKISDNLGTNWRFSGYSFKEDMIGDAIEKMIEAVIMKKYDPEISNNPFAYFTQIAWNSFLQRILKEKKEIYIKHKNFESISQFFQDGDNIEKLFSEEEHVKIIDDFEKRSVKLKVKSNLYISHKNLSYRPNRELKGRKKKEEENAEESRN